MSQPARPPATAHCADGRDGLRRGRPRLTPAHPYSELNVQYFGDNSRDGHRAGTSEPVRLASHQGALEITAARRAADARRACNSPGRQEGATHRRGHNAQRAREAATRPHRSALPVPQRHCHRRAGDDFAGTCRHGLLPSPVGPRRRAQSTVLRPQAGPTRIPEGVFLPVTRIAARFRRVQPTRQPPTGVTPRGTARKLRSTCRAARMPSARRSAGYRVRASSAISLTRLVAVAISSANC